MTQMGNFHNHPRFSNDNQYGGGRRFDHGPRQKPEQIIMALCTEHRVGINGALPLEEKLERIAAAVNRYEATHEMPVGWCLEAVRAFRNCIQGLVTHGSILQTPAIRTMLQSASTRPSPNRRLVQTSPADPATPLANDHAMQDPHTVIKDHKLNPEMFVTHFDDALRTLITNCWPHIDPEILFSRKNLRADERAEAPDDTEFMSVMSQIRLLLEEIDHRLVQRFKGTFRFTDVDLHRLPAAQPVVEPVIEKPVPVQPVVSKPMPVVTPVVSTRQVAVPAALMPMTNAESIGNPLEDSILSVLRQLCPEVNIEKFHRRKTMKNMTTAYMARASLPFQKAMGALYLALADIPGAQKYLCDTFNFNPAQINFWGETGDRLLPWEFVRNTDGHPFSLDAHVMEYISDNLLLRRYEFMRRLGGDPNRNESVRLLSPEIKLQIGELCRKLINTPGAIDRFCEMFDIPKQDALNLMEQTPTPSAPAA